MKVITQKAIEKAGDVIRSKLGQLCGIGYDHTVRSMMVYDDDIGGMVLIPCTARYSDSVINLGMKDAESCKAYVEWTEIDDPTE